MKRSFLLAALALAIPAAAGAQAAPAAAPTPILLRVALIDAVIPQAVSEADFLAVTAKLRAELGSTGQYLVADRAATLAALADAGLVLGGDARTEDLVDAGRIIAPRLDAAFIVVPRVDFLDGTWFVSAKMIDAATGAVTAQAASDEPGPGQEAAVAAASRVGASLASGIVQAERGPARTAAAPRPPRPPAAPFSRVALFAGLPYISGSFEQLAQVNNFDAVFPALSLVVHWQQMLWRGLYGELYVNRTIEQSAAGAVTTVLLTEYNAQAGAGWTFPLGPVAQAGAGLHIGVASIDPGSYWEGLGAAFTGLAYGVEGLLDWRLLAPITLSARADWTLIQGPPPDSASESELSFAIGFGWSY